MVNIDKIYIINKKNNFVNRDYCETQLINNGFNNFIFFDAIYPNEHERYKNLYKTIISKMDKIFIKNNFSIGAFGCLLSHIAILEDAIENKYNEILILENDFLIHKNFKLKFNELKFKIKKDKINYDLIYLGKKQGFFKNYDTVKDIHVEDKYKEIQKINDYLYIPNYQTWATHALLIKKNIFHEIIEFKNNIIAPIDIMLMKLYDKYKFYVLYEDLFISDDRTSDIRTGDSNKLWGWKYDNYIYPNNQIEIKNIVIIGCNDPHHTHSYIHTMYFNFFKHYYPNLNIYWENDTNIIDNKINKNETLFFLSPAHENKLYNLPEESYYIIHLDNPNNKIEFNVIDNFFKKYSNIYKKKKYIILTCRKGIMGLNYFESDYNKNTICLPWFSETFFDKLINLKNNLEFFYYENLNKQYFCYFGSIWDLNISMILDLINFFSKNNLKLLLKGRIFNLSLDTKNEIQNINNKFNNIIFEPFDYNKQSNKNTFEYLNEKYGIKALLPLQGYEHNETYLSNRIFETLSRGYLVITNCKVSKEIFKSSLYNENIDELIKKYVDILNDKNLWMKLMVEQLDEFISKFYGFNNINHILNFLQKCCKINYDMIYYDKVVQANNVLWIRKSDKTNKNTYFANILNDNEIKEAIKCVNNYIINYDEKKMDIYLLNRLLQNKNYTVYIDNDIDLLNNKYLCQILKNVDFKFKNNLEVYCLVSGQRAGSTLIIDILQKNQTNILALSEIFNTYGPNLMKYTDTYDIKNGILKDVNIFNFDGKNISDYFKQFTDYAEYKNYSKFLFKATFDFLCEMEKFMFLNDIINFITQFKIIYLKRNLVNMYTSKKLADIYGYSNVNYEEINEKTFCISELNKFMNNEIEYSKFIDNKLKIYKTIFYTEHNSLNNIINQLNDIFNINIKLNKFEEQIINKKQNNFELSTLVDVKNWS